MDDTAYWLPVAWAALIGAAVAIYVILDGFDLGVGILFSRFHTEEERDQLMNSVAPFWDGNETWLVLGGGGLFAAFPLAYAIIMPALYVPVILMLLCLIFRGVAFEFRFKAQRSRFIWDNAFHFGSLGAAFMQGMILGGFVQGITVEGRAFAGGPFDWLSGFSVMTGLAVTAGYILLGATWLIMKTTDETQAWARMAARYILIFVAFFMALVCLWVPFLDNDIGARWFGDYFKFLWPIPLATAAVFTMLVRSLANEHSEIKPFLCSIGLFLLGYAGLAVSLWPTVVPHSVTLWQAAAAPASLSLLLVGAAIMLPVVLAYTAYCYYVFRGKSSHEPMY